MKSLHVVRWALLTALLFSFVACSKKDETQTSNAENKPEVSAETPVVGDRGDATATFGTATVSINYGRPKLQGRDMLAQATDGIVWRMGMNEATQIKTDAELKFGATVIPPGTYSLFMKKMSADQWELIFNKKTGMWGTEYSAADDLASVPMSLSANSTAVEAFTVELTVVSETAGTLKAMWGTHILSCDFTVSAGGV